ncbi:DNA polymerase alpha/epsilon subunit B-domain-containing protein [Suillus subalutaceus]|uniref:DNA polymerase alpha/epsilon subunit B-domain-containing protein n=1 Tax=Suillus subalutaceus TaxID=48586 RepID=UPI001B871627|nr:DNA polymerase alpha/epsilon subunit B-domain-containing protein [Suillus subalutaceus]KAG1843556.1 DNA polymerase alpha/epsilon subunit B-domain-containing protein [Suillus subalutaceus]
MTTLDSIPTPSCPLVRPTTTVVPPTEMTPSFLIDTKNKSYKHQYANIYFTRLTLLRNAVEKRAKARWDGLQSEPLYVARVLDVVKSQLCWVIGTVYMDMPLKPNVLEDIGRDHSIPAPPPREKFYCDEDSVMLEDESGRLKLVGDRVGEERLVTGVIVAALGMETPTGDFEVVDMCTAGLATFAEEEFLGSNAMDMDVDSSSTQDEYVAVISGLSIGSPSPADAQIQMLVEYLTGEAGGPEDQQLASRITRLIIAGNSLSLAEYGEEGDDEKRPRKFGASAQAVFSPHPNLALSAHLHDLTSALPVHILPGEDDPSGTILPQQPFPRAMFGKAAAFESFHCESNPAWLRVRCDEAESPIPNEGRTSSSQSNHPPVTRSLLVTSGQPVLDMYKYLPTPPSSLVSIAASTLRWRHVAPTAPDTLWCHPYRDRDPFILWETPDIYLVGGMPQFGTELVGSEDGSGRAGRYCRIVLTGVLVLVNLRTLEVQRVDFGVEGLSAGGGEQQPLGDDGDAMAEG